MPGGAHPTYAHGYYNQAKAQGFSPYESGAVAAAGASVNGFAPAYQTAWPAEAEQYGLKHRRHYRA